MGLDTSYSNISEVADSVTIPHRRQTKQYKTHTHIHTHTHDTEN
jgi:hypothetical protein